MKKLILSCLAAATIFTAANAQTTSDDRLKPVEGTWGVGFSINGLANLAGANWMTTGLQNAEYYDPFNVLPAGYKVSDLISQEMLFGRYYLTDKTALRFGLGLNSFSSKSTDRDSVGNEQEETISKFSGFSWGVNFGVEHHCYDNSRRVDPYFGGQLNFGMASPIKVKSTGELPGTGGYSSESTASLRGGINFSIDFVVGAQVFIAKNWALGLESNLGWGMLSYGGTSKRESTYTPTGGTTVKTNAEDFSKTAISGFRVGNTTSLRCSFFF